MPVSDEERFEIKAILAQKDRPFEELKAQVKKEFPKVDVFLEDGITRISIPEKGVRH